MGRLIDFYAICSIQCMWFWTVGQMSDNQVVNWLNKFQKIFKEEREVGREIRKPRFKSQL